MHTPSEKNVAIDLILYLNKRRCNQSFPEKELAVFRWHDIMIV